MDNRNISNVPIGTIVSTLRDITDYGWICCNGNTYENKDGIYNSLIALNIGEFDKKTNIYKTPNYCNMELIERTDYNEIKENNVIENYHYLNKNDMIEDKKDNVLTDYKSTSQKWFTRIINHYVNNRFIFNDNKVQVSWFIKYT